MWARRHHDEPAHRLRHARGRRLNRAKQFYGEGLGWPVQVAQGQYIAFKPGRRLPRADALPTVAYERAALLLAIYGVLAVAAGMTLFVRRDVTT
jgi:hypothetical protein